MTLRRIIADMVERHTLKGLVAIAGHFACEYCKAKGVYYERQGVRWPWPDCAGAPLRDNDDFEAVAR